MKDEQQESMRMDSNASEKVVSGFDPLRRLVGDEKDEFIATFLVDRRIDSYPVDKQELIDETFCLEIMQKKYDDYYKLPVQERKRGSPPPKPPEGFEPVLVWHVLRSLRRLGDVERAPIARAIALDLTGSRDVTRLCLLSEVSSRELTPELVLAHLESLGFGLSKELAVSIARRAFCLMLTEASKREAKQ